MTKETTYSVNDIALFLSNRTSYPYASTCWSRDMHPAERVTAGDAERWFKRYFPSGTSYTVYRKMEAACVAHTAEPEEQSHQVSFDDFAGGDVHVTIASQAGRANKELRVVTRINKEGLLLSHFLVIDRDNTDEHEFATLEEAVEKYNQL
jgi:hypothetical protein